MSKLENLVIYTESKMKIFFLALRQVCREIEKKNNVELRKQLKAAKIERYGLEYKAKYGISKLKGG